MDVLWMVMDEGKRPEADRNMFSFHALVCFNISVPKALVQLWMGINIAAYCLGGQLFSCLAPLAKYLSGISVSYLNLFCFPANCPQMVNVGASSDAFPFELLRSEGKKQSKLGYVVVLIEKPDMYT